MLHIERDNRKSFYFTMGRPLPIHASVLARFEKQKAQLKFLQILDDLHCKATPKSVIEFEQINEALGKDSDNYIRRTIVKSPLSDYIKRLPFDSNNHAHKYATCYSLNYEALSTQFIENEPTEELPSIEQTSSQSDTTLVTQTRVALENERAKSEGFDKNITASMAVATPELTKFLGLARNDSRDSDIQKLGDRGFVKITTSKQQDRIAGAKDVVVILACVYLTYAYHKYRLPFYQNNGIKHPDNRTIVSINSIRQLMKKSRTTDVYQSIRKSLDVTRDTTYDFMAELKLDSGQLEKGITRRRILECDTILDELPSTKEEALNAFYSSNIFILKWDEELFESIIQSETLFALPPDLITIEPILVVLYLKLRSIKQLKVSKRAKAVTKQFALSQFLQNYVNLTPKEFYRIVRKGGKGSQRKTIEGFIVNETSEQQYRLNLFGYDIWVDEDKNEAQITANREEIYRWAQIGDRESPTHFNELAAQLMDIIEQDDEVNARHTGRQIEINRSKHYVTLKEKGHPTCFTISALTTDSMLSMCATLLQDENTPKSELIVKLKELRAKCELLELDKEYLTGMLKSILRYYHSAVQPTIESLTVFLSKEKDVLDLLKSKAAIEVEPPQWVLEQFIEHMENPIE
ncbi:DUF3346 domain-containing protein [Vibrio tubiashii]|uniref:DUF3346 domain-containing protein n=1 Tax=Vibrio tubiashii TaxID=29498 RepID=UPI001EFEC3BF|nr:DUF3346 domain-containing protein [Vibrio tubiashii]MCG9575365.1 DUF3346 domain-containing protein [Vibrio tubiashii]